MFNRRKERTFWINTHFVTVKMRLGETNMNPRKEKLVLAAAFIAAAILLPGCGSSAAGTQLKMATSPYAASDEAAAQVTG